MLRTRLHSSIQSLSMHLRAADLLRLLTIGLRACGKGTFGSLALPLRPALEYRDIPVPYNGYMLKMDSKEIHFKPRRQFVPD